MSLPELCIRRPVMTTLLMLAFVIFGLFSYRLLPVAATYTLARSYCWEDECRRTATGRFTATSPSC